MLNNDSTSCMTLGCVFLLQALLSLAGMLTNSVVDYPRVILFFFCLLFYIDALYKPSIVRHQVGSFVFRLM